LVKSIRRIVSNTSRATRGGGTVKASLFCVPTLGNRAQIEVGLPPSAAISIRRYCVSRPRRYRHGRQWRDEGRDKLRRLRKPAGGGTIALLSMF
jgi:hypothetical protein